MRNLIPLLSLLLCICPLPLAAEEPAGLVELRQGWEEARGTKQQRVDKIYFEELEELKKNFVKAGNIEAARAVAAAIKGEKKADNEPEALTQMRLARDKSLQKTLKPLDKQYWQDLKKLREDYQKQGSLAGIETTDAEIKKVLAAYKKPEPPKKKEAQTEDGKEEPKEKRDDDPKEDNNPKAAAILEKAKDKDAQFQYDLARRYLNENGVEKDEEMGIKLLHMAAEQNHALACNALGWHYRYGVRVKLDIKEAVEWFHKGADLGEQGCQFHLGECYRDGLGVRKNGKKAVEWFSKCAEQGVDVAMFCLGKIYRDGEGIPKNTEKALEWFHKASDKGSQHAQYALGKLYRDGDGVPKDKEKAAEWFTKAADQGHKEAKLDLELLK